MTEKNDDPNEQQTFLSDHENMLNSISAKAETSTDQPEAVEPVEETPEEQPETVEETPVAETLPETRKPATTAGPNKLGGKKKKKKNPVQSQHSPQHEEQLKKQALEQSEVKEVLTFLLKYAKPAIIAIVAVCAFFLLNGFFRNNRVGKEIAADTALMQANSMEALQEIVDKYASTPTGPFALMSLARDKFQEGQIDEAEALYTHFTEKHGSHELAAQAELNLITCKETKGQLDEAQALYGKFGKSHETSFLAPVALMNQARCLEALDRLEEARIAYEDIGAKYPVWARPADAKLNVLLGKMK